MRRSKSNPAKYARNYRSISQRQMTAFDHLDEQAEMQRLQTILQNSKNHLKQHDVQDDSGDNDSDNNKRRQIKKSKVDKESTEAGTVEKREEKKDGNTSDDEFERARALLRNSTAHLQKGVKDGEPTEDAMILNKKNKKGKRKRKAKQEAEEEQTKDATQTSNNKDAGTTKDVPKNTSTSSAEPVEHSLLSKEFLDQNNPNDDNNNEENPLIVTSKKKKKQKKKSADTVIELTPEEIKQAKQLQKKTQRKLQQLALRAKQKEQRAVLYEKLCKSAISAQEFELLESSATLGKRMSKKEQLKKLLQKERAGLTLTQEEQELLYRKRKNGNPQDEESSSDEEDSDRESPPKQPKRDEISQPVDHQQQKSNKKNKKKRKRKQRDEEEEEEIDDDNDKRPSGDNNMNDASNDNATATNHTSEAKSFAAQMMASLSSLKVTSEKQKEENDKKRRQEQERRDEQPLPLPKHKPYKVQDPIVVETAATNKRLQVHPLPVSSKRNSVVSVTRSQELQELRYELPVLQMEFEIMDAIRNNDVTIICGETGSGKSTQIPQLLYESGFTLGKGDNQDDDDDHHRPNKYKIGITQPRRVAAVSTAKRVCYEMGRGNGKSIHAAATTRTNNNNHKRGGEGNLVAYQTRYETAGLGDGTGIKFMTDGILLQEIQSDLLLRDYSVIVLDECHERNLNCDILCGLIGLALPLRKKASEEPGSDIVPLKLVIMSATLRVDDFVGNRKLFPSTIPKVVKVPGRTFPVTIHHSKMTELDDYEDVAFQKVCKIHRKLPQGGILVFLTGKHEIVRMVNRLRKALGRRKSKTTTESTRFDGSNDVEASRTDITYSNEDGGLRDLDDDEVDADMFETKEENDDEYDDDENDATQNGPAEPSVSSEANDNLPKDVIVLPLYSMLSAEEQAKVFAAEQEGHRLIVVSTNIAETSITIPGISYVVDTGREKCKNYDAKTGVSSFDISWISKAAANQRAGRAGRTGPGHCYRLYSSSMFSRHMDDFALPEVLTRPLEDVVLAMKAMKISNVSKFPFPTPPAENQIAAATSLLANLGCIHGNDNDEDDLIAEGGAVSHLGAAIATLPLGVRCGKMLLVAAHAGVLDYAIAIIAVLSEKSPLLRGEELAHGEKEKSMDSSNDNDENYNDDSSSEVNSPDESKEEKNRTKWSHKSGDVYAVMLAIGAYTYAGKGAGGVTEKVACEQFCQENGLNPVIMERIQKIRSHLSRLVKARMAGADGAAAKTGKIPHSMKPPNKVQERLLLQVIASCFLDNVAMLAPLGSIPGSHPFSLRSAYLSCSSSLKEPLFLDRNSVLYSRDSRRLPQWVCYDYLVRKNLKDGTPIATMKNISPVDPSWLGSLAKGSNLLSTGGPLATPRPTYDPDRDEILCSVETRFGNHKWEIAPLKRPMGEVLRETSKAKQHLLQYQADDSFRYFARFLLEGKVLPSLQGLKELLNDDPSILTSKTAVPAGKVALLVTALSEAGVESAAKLKKQWSEVDDKFLFKVLKKWVKPKHASRAKRIWIETVKKETKR